MNSDKKQNRHSATPKVACASLLLSIFSDVAIKNADSLCRGWMFEPEIPKKLKRK